MTAPELTDEQRAKMLHAIGGKLIGGNRNYYVTDAPDDDWEALVSAGMATSGPRPFREAGALYRVSSDGLAALTAQMPSDGRKAYEVKIGDHAPVVARGTTRSKARAVAVSEYADAFNESFGEALLRVRYIRRAPWCDGRGHYGSDELLTTSDAKQEPRSA